METCRDTHILRTWPHGSSPRAGCGRSGSHGWAGCPGRPSSASLLCPGGPRRCLHTSEGHTTRALLLLRRGRAAGAPAAQCHRVGLAAPLLLLLQLAEDLCKTRGAGGERGRCSLLTLAPVLLLPLCELRGYKEAAPYKLHPCSAWGTPWAVAISSCPTWMSASACAGARHSTARLSTSPCPPAPVHTELLLHEHHPSSIPVPPAPHGRFRSVLETLSQEPRTTGRETRDYRGRRSSPPTQCKMPKGPGEQSQGCSK